MFGSPEGSGHLVEAFKRGLAEAGYVEGRNLRIESRWAMGNSEKLAEITKELIALKPDVVLVGTVAVARALLEKTTTTPIIGVAVDLLGTGLVNNLARPGGNLTGLSSLTVDTTAKLIELHRLISPSLSKLAVLTNSI
jgi:putative ABC transport system substrate-binding protein